eukprot:gene13901-16401_t
MLQIGFGWAAFGIVVAYYSDKHEAEKLTTIVTVLGLTIMMCAVLIIPVDILNVSTMSNKNGTFVISQDDIDNRNTSMRIIYYAFSLIIIPFAYFFYEENDEGMPLGPRIFAGCKYTSFLIVFTIVLLVVGAFVRPGTKSIDNQNVKDWIQTEILNQNAAEGSLMFAIACTTLLGFIVWITYTAYGLSAFPVGLIKGKRRVSDDRNDLDADLFKTREKANYYSSKFASGKSMSANEEAALSLLKSKERVLKKHSDRLEASQSGIRKVLVIFRPFGFIFGFIFLAFSIVIWISIGLSLIDKISSSVCGSACGFLTTYPKLKNPVDLALSFLAPYFPLDYVCLGLLIVYIYFCTLSGIVKIGIRFLWIKMYEFTPFKTLPQGLLVASVLLMFSNLCLSFQILQLAPRYGMFGTQVWQNVTTGAISDCTLDAPTDLCVMSQIGVLSSRIIMGTSFFGIIYYYATWVFIGTFLIGCLVSIIKGRSSNVVKYNNDSDEDI